MKLRFVLGLAVLVLIGCAKDAPVTSKTDPVPLTPPASASTTGDTPAAGQMSASAQKLPTAPATTPAAVPAKPAATATIGATPPVTTPATAPANGAYVFTYAPSTGQLNYKMTMSMDMGKGQPMNMTSTMSSKATKNADGTYTVVSTTSGPAAAPGGSKSASATTVINSKGKVISSKINGGASSSDPFGSSSISNALPDHPVKIGDTWNMTGGKGKAASNMRCKLIKVDDKGGVQMATIQILSLEVPAAGGMKVKLTKPALISMEVNTGTLHTMNLDADMAFGGSSSAQAGNAGMAIPTSIKVHMKMEKQ